MKSFKNRTNDYFLSEDGENLFEIALFEAMNKEGRKSEVTVHDLVGGEPRKGIMISGKDAYIGLVGVEWHSRWCFYYFDREGRNFIADYEEDNNRVSIGNCVGYYKEEKEAIEQALINCGIMS
jgi:hypothetical protein